MVLGGGPPLRRRLAAILEAVTPMAVRQLPVNPVTPGAQNSDQQPASC